jgi:hypothetical protein
MDINNAFALSRDGKLGDCSLDELRAMSSGCVVHIQNRTPASKELKDAIDDEIRRKETQRAADRLLQQMERLTGNIVELVGIAAEQKRLAAKLDVQTDTLISLTRWLRGLTIALVVLAIPLFLEALHLIEVRKNSAETGIHMSQTNQPTQQSTNH